MIPTGESGYTREKLLPVPLCPRLIQHGMTLDFFLRVFPCLTCVQYCIVLDIFPLSLALTETQIQISL